MASVTVTIPNDQLDGCQAIVCFGTLHGGSILVWVQRFLLDGSNRSLFRITDFLESCPDNRTASLNGSGDDETDPGPEFSDSNWKSREPSPLLLRITPRC